MVDELGSAIVPRPSDDIGTEAAYEPGVESMDPWAEAFAESSRLGVPAPIPEYAVVVNEQVQFFVDRFSGSRREVVNLWAGRSGRYLGMIREVMRANGLPEDLAYTAMIESGFNPLAVSHAGAKGLWQFMAATARRYGLRVDQWIDERLDPEKSTVAAAAYLRDLYGLFGSWTLAKAAYNAGEMRITRAMRATGTTDFWTLARTNHLRKETKEFVPRIHAATVIGRDPARYGIEFGGEPAEPADTVSVPPATDLRRVAAATGIPLATLRGLNPVLVRGVTPPGGRWALKVPAGTGDAVTTALAPKKRRPATVVAAATSPAAVRAASAGARVHVVRPRDTVSGIAKQYGVSVRDVVRWNGLEEQDRIRPGDRLRISEVRTSAAREGQGGLR